MSDREVIEKAASNLGMTIPAMFLLVAKAQPLQFTNAEEVAKSWLQRYKRERIPCLIKFASKAVYTC
jgi:hypothetical protein